MQIAITAAPEEIAALVVAIQERTAGTNGVDTNQHPEQVCELSTLLSRLQEDLQSKGSIPALYDSKTLSHLLSD